MFSNLYRGFYVAVLLACKLALADSNNTVRLTNGEWAPYTGENIPNQGVITDIVSKAFEAVGYKVKYEFFPWVRTMELAKKDPKWDGTFPWVRNPKREKIFFYSDPLIVIGEYFFYRSSDSFDWSEYNDLINYRIGMTRGYTYGPEFMKSVKELDLEVELASSDLININKLIRKRIDLFPGAKQVILNLLKGEFHETKLPITYHPKPIHTEPYYLLISKKTKNGKGIVLSFNEGLKSIKKSGLYKKILQQ